MRKISFVNDDLNANWLHAARVKTRHNLNSEQLSAVWATKQNVLVLAGPGTGKTHMLVSKYVHLVVDKGLSPDRILITTFTTKATAELEERIGAELAKHKHYSKVEVSNFHSFCLRLLQEFGQGLDLPKDPTVLDGVALNRFLFENRDRFDWEFVPYIRYVHFPLERLTTFVGRCLSEGITPEEALTRATRMMEEAPDDEKAKVSEYLDYAKNYAVVMELLRSKHILTYDLMLFHAVALLEKDAATRKQVMVRYDYFLVDEAQDNNGLQTKLIELLVGARPVLTVVGDEDQGIYKFRGARQGNLQDMAGTFNPAVVHLVENFRSTTHIVEAAKTLIAANPGRMPGKDLVAVGPNRDVDVPIEIVACPSETQEAIRLAAMIQEELALGTRPKDVAVIYRSLNHKEHLLEELEARGIPYEVANTGELLRIREVRDLWAWLSVLSDPYTDNPSFERVLAGHDMGIGLLDLGRIQQRFKRTLEEEAKAKGEDPKIVRLNLVDVLRNLEGAHVDDASRHRLRWARRTLEVLSEKTRGLGALDSAYAVLGWLKPQKRYPPSDGRHKQVWLNLAQFLRLIKDYEQNYPDASGLPGFLSYLDYLDRQGAEFKDARVDEGQDSVKILTAHAAKGLEFPVVFLASCCEKRFPGGYRGDWIHPILSSTDPAQLHAEEERRVFYVAMTRAKKRLVLTHPVTIGGKPRARSTFLDDLMDNASTHVRNTIHTEELPASVAETVQDSEWMGELHGALTVHEGLDAEEAKDRVKRMIAAALTHWQGTVKPEVLEEIASLTGAELPRPKETKAPERQTLRLSASALNTYADCPRKFQYQNVLQIPRRINANAVAGSNVHRALEVFHKERKADWRQATTEELLAIYDHVAAEARFSTPKEAEQFRARDKRILASYVDGERDNPGEPTYFEVPYSYHDDASDATFTGYIDRVDRHPDGSVEIVDYKTGKKKSNNKIVGEDYQIPLYVLAFEEGKGEKVKAGTLYWMREAGDGTGPIERARIPRVSEGKKKGEFTDSAVAEFKERLRGTVEKIRNGEFVENVDEYGCSVCDYRILCPAWGG